MANIQFLEDRLIYVHGWTRRIFGEPDVYEKREVLYKDIPNLPPEPTEFGFEDNYYNWHERLEPIFVEKAGRIIVFHSDYRREKDLEQAEEYLEGPFLVSE